MAILCGGGLTPIMGGVPATAAIARTAVNVRAGARSKLAALTHAAGLAVIVLVLTFAVTVVFDLVAAVDEVGGEERIQDGPSLAQTRYGPVQVQVTIAGKRITGVKTLRHPSGDDRSIQIAADALPQLRSETLAAQSAQIDTVGGATYTSEGYQQSLQGALDLAHFG